MNNWTLYIYLCGASLLLMGLGLGLAAIMPDIDRWSKRFFIVFFSILFLNSCFALIEIIFYEVPGKAFLQVFSNFWMSLLATFPLPMLTAFLLHCCGEDLRKSSLFHAVSVLYGLYFLLVVIAQFTAFIYYLTPDGHLHRGSLYSLAVAPLVTIGLLNLSGLIRRRSALTKKLFIATLISLIPLTFALIIHLFVPAFPLVNMGVAILALSMYGIILSDQIEQYLRQQREIAHQHASILVLQMRPHFIHNTLMNIYYLCRQDPAEAQRVTLDFNTFLERNLNALASDETIPFSEELVHTRAYLNVEQALHDENLHVEYDMPHTRFRVPPLTLQPIVENAVKHGMNPDADPLLISIQARKTDAGSEIVVSDNGPGFAPAQEGGPHIALQNIRQRLELMCGGTMSILPREGGGTIVKLTIPGSAPENGA